MGSCPPHTSALQFSGGSCSQGARPPWTSHAHILICILRPRASVRGPPLRLVFGVAIGVLWVRPFPPLGLGTVLLLSASPSQLPGCIRRQEPFVWGSWAVSSFSCHLTLAWCPSMGKMEPWGAGPSLLCLLPAQSGTGSEWP